MEETENAVSDDSSTMTKTAKVAGSVMKVERDDEAPSKTDYYWDEYAEERAVRYKYEDENTNYLDHR